MRRQPITKFEHEKLLLREEQVDNVLLKALHRYHGTEGTPYFSLIHQGIKFNQYVGAIQVGNSTIEVLPKVDRLSHGRDAWRRVLIQMLRITQGIEARATSSSQLKVLPNSIFNLYIELFISECEKLTHRGLIKRYQCRRENKSALKGRLDIPGQIRHNLVHKERFYVEYSAYDQDHRINQILKKTLEVLAVLTPVPTLQNRIKRQLLYFEDISSLMPNEGTFHSIRYGRKNQHYQRALEIARLILLNYHPDIQQGQNQVLALMFDMNELWEKYIAMQFRKHLRDQFEIKTQKGKEFWRSDHRSKRVKPDLLLKDRSASDGHIVVDTKWKIPDGHGPGDDDLRQMFAYNRLFGCSRSILLYPGSNDKIVGQFRTPYGGSCTMVSLNLLHADGSLNQNRELLSPIMELIDSQSELFEA